MQIFVILVDLFVDFDYVSEPEIQLFDFVQCKYAAHYELVDVAVFQEIGMLGVDCFHQFEDVFD